jgi:multimeric flavodoxin WrbA
MKILIINASHRKGNTDIATKRLIDKLQEDGHETRELVLRDIEMKLPDGCEICAESGICPNVHDQFSEEIESTIRNYNLYILATPVWSDNITPLAKMFWDKIVSWCHQEKMYLKNKRIALVVHGMADPNSWDGIVNWFKGLCTWEQSTFTGYLSFKSSSKIGKIELDDKAIRDFVKQTLA